MNFMLYLNVKSMQYCLFNLFINILLFFVYNVNGSATLFPYGLSEGDQVFLIKK